MHILLAVLSLLLGDRCDDKEHHAIALRASAQGLAALQAPTSTCELMLPAMSSAIIQCLQELHLQAQAQAQAQARALHHALPQTAAEPGLPRCFESATLLRHTPT